MFSVYCSSCDTEVLVSTRRILSMHNTSEGIVIYYRCICGEAGVMATGRSATEQTSHHVSDSRAADSPAPVPAGDVSCSRGHRLRASPSAPDAEAAMGLRDRCPAGG
jgi:hypothetical protein